MSVLTAFFVVIGYIIGILLTLQFGGTPLYVVAVFFVLAAGLSAVSYFYGDRIVLRMYNAQIVSENIAPELYSKVSRLAKKAALPIPKIAIISNESPNTFATGRTPENSVVAVTSGALSLLQRDELEAVLAHELGHIKSGDMFTSTVAAVTAKTFTCVRLTPLAAVLTRLAVSRNYEYEADETGAAISGKPQALADALVRLEEAVRRTPMSGCPATAHLFIVSPCNPEKLRLMPMHPSTKDRVQKLRKMTQPPHK